MRRVTTYSILDSNKSISQILPLLYSANRHFRSRGMNSKQNRYLQDKDFHGFFQFLFKLDNHFNDYAEKKPIRGVLWGQAVALATVYFLACTYFAPSNISSIKWALRESNREIRRCADSLEKIADQMKVTHSPGKKP